MKRRDAVENASTFQKRVCEIETMEWLENTNEFQQRNMYGTLEQNISMYLALQRIQQCKDRRLDLSRLELTELPPLPDDLIMLRCDSNQLTSLPTLPSSLRIFHCHGNQLTSLPDLPPFLESLSCSNNPLRSLPPLPSSLTQLVCMQNQLTSLPPLPHSLLELCFDYNDVTRLQELPPHLSKLSCTYNQLTYLPSLPSLESLYLFSNPLISLPELPSTLIHVVCVLPHNNERFAPRPVTPEMIQQVNLENQEWAESLSKKRSMERCFIYYEELMHNRWNPDRIDYLCSKGYAIGDMY